jgi:hypothetical protein
VQSFAARLSGWKGTVVGGTAVGGTVVAGTTAVAAGPQAVKIMPVSTTSDMSKYIERFTISLLGRIESILSLIFWGINTNSIST